MLKMINSVLGLITAASFLTCSSTRISSDNVDAPVISFPGAEGFGKFTTGGRGGQVVVVNTLNDSGPGSLREAVAIKKPRIIVFAVAGTIHLETPLNIRSNVTIAGQTAPGEGICIADQPVKIDGDNVIIRYLRFRMGDRFQSREKVHGSGHDDALGASNKKHIIIDHCSLSWSTDEVMSVYNGDSTTLQWNLIAEPLNYSYHFEEGGTDYQRHGYGGIWGGAQLSAHHNLFAHCISRTPRFNGIRQRGNETVDFVNNVIYNWEGNNVYGGEGGRYNVVSNYYKPGPGTRKTARSRLLNPFRTETIPYGQFFVKGNYMEGEDDVNRDNWKGVELNKGTSDDLRLVKVDKPFTNMNVSTQTAREAFVAVLEGAGCSYARDTMDQRIINDVKNGTGRFVDVQGGFPHGTDYANTVKAWPTLKKGTAPVDTDGDGMPDEWEKSKGLNPQDASDASVYSLDKRYTNIELYINGILNEK